MQSMTAPPAVGSTTPALPVEAGPRHLPAWHGETYYGRPAMKSSHYGWLIVLYFFVGGLASAAQFIATVVDLFGPEEDKHIVRTGRFIALAGALVSPAILVADLHKPIRWYNMLRIYRGTSAMSIGSWALSAFGAASGLVALGQVAEDLGLGIGRWASRIAQLPAAIAGGIVALYTGTLMASTNLPAAAGAFPNLSSLFASSAASSATAALSLAADLGGAPEGIRRRLNLFALMTGVGELIFALLIERGWRRWGSGLTGPDRVVEMAYRAGVLGFGVAAPAALHAAQAARGRESKFASVVAALLALAGGFFLRAVFVLGANRSAKRPEAYLGLTQPDTIDDMLHTLL